MRPLPSQSPALAIARRAVAVLLVSAVAAGCSSTRALHGAPAEVLRALPAKQEVRLRLAGGEQVDVDQVTVVGDSLRARLTDDHQLRRYGERAESRPVTYALADVLGVESIRVDPVKTSLLVAGCIAAAAALWTAADLVDMSIY